MASKAFLERTMVKTEPTKVQNSGMTSGKRTNPETLSPFDVTLYKGGVRAGGLPSLHHRQEAEEEAFSNHLHTGRRAPGGFLRKGEGMGGQANAAQAVAAQQKKAVHTIAPILHKVSVGEGSGACAVVAWPLSLN
jgi:hypothetical protein